MKCKQGKRDFKPIVTVVCYKHGQFEPFEWAQVTHTVLLKDFKCTFKEYAVIISSSLLSNRIQKMVSLPLLTFCTLHGLLDTAVQEQTTFLSVEKDLWLYSLWCSCFMPLNDLIAIMTGRQAEHVQKNMVATAKIQFNKL